VNLIVERTDYTGGLVMPAAIHFSTWVAAVRPEDRVRGKFQRQVAVRVLERELVRESVRRATEDRRMAEGVQ
jgi:galactokinase